MSTAANVKLDARQVRDAINGIAEFVSERRDISPAERALLQFDFERARIAFPSLERAVDKRPTVGLLTTPSAAGDLLIATLAGARDARAMGLFAGGAARLPIVRGLLPKTDQLGLAAGIRLAHDNPNNAAAKAADTVGRMMTGAAGQTAGVSIDGTRRSDSGVRVDLLSLADVITVLARAYYAHVKTQGAAPQVDDIKDVLKRAAGADTTTAMQTGLTAHNVAALRIYLEQRFRDHPRLQVLAAAGFWDTFATLGPRATLDGRRRLASLLWGGLGDFDTVFAELAGALEKLNHAPDVICPTEAVRALTAGVGFGEAHPFSILAAGTLLSNADAAGEPLEVRSRFGQPIAVARNILTALAREVTLTVEGDPSALLATADVLQLPTLCLPVIPRETLSRSLDIRPRDAAADAPWLARAMMQAKTLFLTEDAAVSLGLSGLVLHLDATTPLAGQFAPIVAHWIEQTQGQTPQQRAANDTTLFVAVDPSDAAHPIAPLKAFLGTSRLSGWLDRWSTDTAFDNLFILGLAQRAAGAALTADTLKQLPRAGAGTALATLDTSRAALDAAQWMKHVRDAAVTVDEALNAGDGGIVYLAQSIAAVDYGRAKRRQIAARLSDTRTLLADTLDRFLYATAPDAENDWRHRAALATQARLRAAMSDQRIGHLIAALLPGERECAWLFERLAADIQTDAEADGLLRRLAALDRIDSSSAEHIAGRYAADVMAHWFRVMRATAIAPGGPLAFGFAETTFGHLIEEIAIAAMRTDVPGRMAAGVARHLVSSSGAVTLHATRAAMVANDVIAMFLANLGFDSPWSSRHPRRRGTLGAPLFERAAAATPEDLATMQASRITLQFGADWCEGFGLMTEENIAAARGMRFEESEYRELAELLALLSSNARERVL